MKNITEHAFLVETTELKKYINVRIINAFNIRLLKCSCNVYKIFFTVSGRNERVSIAFLIHCGIFNE